MRAVVSIYLLILGITLGVEVGIGIVAPVIFRSDLYIQAGTLSTLNAGILLAQVFIKYNYLAAFGAIFYFIFELVNFKKSTQNFKIKISLVMLTFLNLLLALLFWYFTNYIISATTLGEAGLNEGFASVHSASELTLKFAMIAQAFLFFLKARISLKEKF